MQRAVRVQNKIPEICIQQWLVMQTRKNPKTYLVLAILITLYTRMNFDLISDTRM